MVKRQRVTAKLSMRLHALPMQNIRVRMTWQEFRSTALVLQARRDHASACMAQGRAGMLARIPHQPWCTRRPVCAGR